MTEDQTEEYQTELEQLRAQVELYRQNELNELRRRLAEAENAVVHYREEANRLSNAAREIHSHYEQKIRELQAKIAAYEQYSTWSRRDSRSTR